ncbi:Endonuclease/exonuclease/phosphatase [Penicillium cf. griseofulvum]|uniref:Endonuclease/exonuclease/phosphatase n=1 Tax=Penicillium cf. griseofulvum TaxID=2972120 RepID=A0A9W9J2X4_9EURO|nr:Endonuclease/exonuclease/phosphatase [Penicillium cf. griseofulvum]KAJ5435118.1 Endonuclease/exonuclease/phosphatase [Penicillium cf. griseofulvum]
MDIFAQIRSMVWKHDTPLKTDLLPDPKFQSWHQFNPNSQHWDPVSPNENAEPPHADDTTSDLVLLTWNIDAFAKRTQERIAEILTFITELESKVDVIFLQEVSPRALGLILADERTRGSWFSSEDENTPCGNSFTTMTLVSKTRFRSRLGSDMSGFALGPVWRVSFPSHFGRDVLFCDLFVPSSTDVSSTRVRLANVHLDSLPIRPSHRPRQLSIVSSFLRSAGCGLVAGDFNPVLDEDAVLIESNGLTDAWVALHPEEPGYTWGADGKQQFPPNRMDRIALLGLKARQIEILEARQLEDMDEEQNTQGDTEILESWETQPTVTLWSDHHGLLCSFRLAE